MSLNPTPYRTPLDRRRIQSLTPEFYVGHMDQTPISLQPMTMEAYKAQQLQQNYCDHASPVNLNKSGLVKPPLFCPHWVNMYQRNSLPVRREIFKSKNSLIRKAPQQPNSPVPIIKYSAAKLLSFKTPSKNLEISDWRLDSSFRRSRFRNTLRQEYNSESYANVKNSIQAPRSHQVICVLDGTDWRKSTTKYTTINLTNLNDDAMFIPKLLNHVSYNFQQPLGNVYTVDGKPVYWKSEIEFKTRVLIFSNYSTFQGYLSQRERSVPLAKSTEASFSYQQQQYNFSKMRAWEKQVIQAWQKREELKLIDMYSIGFPIDYPLRLPFHNVTVTNAPLMAATLQLYNLLQLLYEHGSDLNLPDSDGNCAVHYATREGDAKTIAILGKYGVDFDVNDREGNTLLHLAAMYGQPQAAKYFVRKKKLNMNVRNNRNEKPFETAQRCLEEAKGVSDY